jgi:FkbM family methyltransferase
MNASGVFTNLARKIIQKITSPFYVQKGSRGCLAFLLLDKKYFGWVLIKLMRIVTMLDSGMTIYTLTNSGKQVPTSSFMATEEDMIKVFTPRKGDVVVDAGAFVGRYTLMASKIVGETGSVLSFEPDSRAYQVLKRNVMVNNATNVRMFNLALSSYDGQCEFSFNEPGLSSQKYQIGQKVIIPCRTLDSILAKEKVTRVDWVKVDVEGNEAEVLKGMTRLLDTNRKVKCIFELHHTQGTDKVKPELLKMGFQVVTIKNNRILAFR